MFAFAPIVTDSDVVPIVTNVVKDSLHAIREEKICILEAQQFFDKRKE